MSEWKETKLNDLTSRITKGTTPSTIGGAFVPKGINFIKSESVSYNGKIDKSTFAFISEETHNKLKRSQLEKNDILFSMAGIYLGKSGYVTEDLLPANTNQALAIIKVDSLKALPKFIHFVLQQKSVIEYVNTISGQSAQPNINMEEIGSIELLLPPLPEQESIAEVLSSLDDKIDLLHRQNKTLEEMAETLFRQWFVEEAEEEIVEISLSDISKHVKRSINPSKSAEQLFKHYSLPSFDNGRNPDIQFGREILSNKYQISPGQILISKLNPRTPRVWFINSCDNYSICSTEFQVYEPLKKEYTEFIYCLLKSNETRDILSGASSGTSGSHQRVNPEDINKLSIKQPKNEILYKFHQITSAWLLKIDSNSLQIQHLETLRDTLLPKLMSGSVTVNEIA